MASPAAVSLVRGERAALSVVATEPGGEPVKVRLSDTELVIDPPIVKAAGDLLVAVEPGEADLVLRWRGRSSPPVHVVVAEAQVDALTLSQPQLVLSAGEASMLSVRASLKGGVALDASELASWSSSDPHVAAVDGGKLVATGFGEATVRASWRGVDSAPATVRVPAERPAKVEVGPAPVRVYVGRTADVEVTATLADGRVVRADEVATLSAAHPEIAVYEQGVLRAARPGATTVTATVAGVRSAPVDVQVMGGSPIVGLTVAPPLGKLPFGARVALEATGVDAIGYRADLTDVVKWQSSDPVIATVSEAGVVDVVGRGKAAITATIEKVRSQPIEISTLEGTVVDMALDPPLVQMAPGDFVEVRVRVRLSTGDVVTVTSPIDWRTDNFFVADVNDGLLAAGEPGRTDLHAGWVGGVHLVAPVFVTPPGASPVEAIGVPGLIRPGERFTPAAAAQTPAGHVDVTAAAQWVSLDSRVIRVLKSGRELQGVAAGTATVRAGWGGRVSAPTAVRVASAPAKALTLELPDDVKVNSAVPASLVAELVDGVTGDVAASATWTVEGDALRVERPGELRAVAQGKATVVVVWEALVARRQVTVR